jgi:hypothetical protein
VLLNQETKDVFSYELLEENNFVEELNEANLDNNPDIRDNVIVCSDGGLDKIY